MSQITWRNIDAPDLTNVVRGVAEANRAIQEAFGGFNTALQRFQEDRERNVSKELLAGALGASDEAGLDSFMQGQRAQQLLASGLMNPETLASVSQQRSNLLSQAINRTGLEQIQNDMATQGALAEAAYALGIGEQVDPSLLANALNNSRASQVLPDLAARIRAFDFNVLNADRNFELAQQKLRLLQQQASASNTQGRNPYGSIDKNGKLIPSPQVEGFIRDLVFNSPNEAAAISSYLELLEQANIPSEYRPAFDKLFESSLSTAKKHWAATGTPDKVNYFLSDFSNPGAVTKLADTMGVDLGKGGAQTLYHALNNLRKNQPDVVLSENDIKRILNTASSLEKSGKLNSNPGKIKRGFDALSSAFSVDSPAGPMGAPMSLFNQVLGSVTGTGNEPEGTGNEPEDLYIHGGDKYQNEAVRNLSEALIKLDNLNATVNGEPFIFNLGNFKPPYFK